MPEFFHEILKGAAWTAVVLLALIGLAAGVGPAVLDFLEAMGKIDFVTKPANRK